MRSATASGQLEVANHASPGRLRSLGERLFAFWAPLPPWAQALAVFASTRLVGFVILEVTARFQPANPWTHASPGYLDFITMWDGDWYRRIAEFGYPSTLPQDPTGHVAQNGWAFYLLYPWTVRVLMRVSGLGWPLTASLVSLLCGVAAVIVLRSLIARIAGASAALWTVVFFCTFPAAPVLQLAYSESMGALLLFAVLWCLQRHRYVWAIPLLLLLGVARPISVPLAAVVALHVIRRGRERAVKPLPPKAVADLIGLCLAAFVSAVAWPLAAALSTGDPRAYTDTMGAWRESHDVHVFSGWIPETAHGFAIAGPVLALIEVAVGVGWWLTRRHAQVIAGDIRAWLICYLCYLAAVLQNSTSIVRYLLLAFPFGTLLAVAPPLRRYRVALAIAGVIGQVVWVAVLWRVAPPADLPP